MTDQRHIKRARKCSAVHPNGMRCRNKFIPRNSGHVVCSPECAVIKGEADKAKKARKEATKQRQELREAKVKAKTRREWMSEAQAAFNKFVRIRDSKDGCISCDKPATWQGQWHASHYYATSIRPNLRFNENNVHKACSICNNYMHGNLTPYRERLIVKIGIDEMKILDADKAPAKFTIQDLIEIKAKYGKKTRELEHQMQD